jgi:hypothetical protein
VAAARLPARPAVSVFRLPSEDDPHFLLGLLEDASAARVETFSGAIDEERQHRHRRAVGGRLALPAALGGPLERQRDLPRAALSKNARLEGEGMARLRHPFRPSPRGPRGRASAPARAGSPSRRDFSTGALGTHTGSSARMEVPTRVPPSHRPFARAVPGPWRAGVPRRRWALFRRDGGCRPRSESGGHPSVRTGKIIRERS